VPEGTDDRPRRIYLTEGSNLVGVDPSTGRVKATASGSAVNGAAGVYVVRGGVALGLDQGGNGDAWGYDIAVQRVTLAAAGLPWPHYFVDLGGVGGSADPASGLVIIAACEAQAQSSPTQPSASAPSGSAPAPSALVPSALVPSAPVPSAPVQSALAPAGPASSPSVAISGSPATSGSSDSSGSTPAPGSSPSASTGAVQGCLHPELVALNL
jgi:hypothetical protein